VDNMDNRYIITNCSKLHHMITNLIAIRIRDLDGVRPVSNSI
jgi:hypothetical protein